ncbi:hypothetical protein [Paenarthrobacter sp. YIM B13468]|uniref:hypothetical protein n=1 Tax=Paenarthrobacter sp. YIM B13468 TaxID=3366295 RepID=UPI00366B1EBC
MTGRVIVPQRRLPVPVVVLNGSTGAGEYLSVLPDEGRRAASGRAPHTLGHRRVHILGTSEPQHWTVAVRRRIESLLTEFSKAGVDAVHVSLKRPLWDFEAGREKAFERSSVKQFSLAL